MITAKDQTVTAFGMEKEELARFITEYRPKGINRIVPFGQAMEFSTIWDGYDLLREFCREVDLRFDLEQFQRIQGRHVSI